MPTLVSSLRRIRPGEGMPLDYSAWNAFLDAQQTTEDKREIEDAGGNTPELALNEILVNNQNTGRRIARGECLAIDGVLNTSGDKPRFRNQIAVKGLEPSIAGFGKSVISRDGVPAGGWNEMLAGGVAVARIYAPVEHRWMEFADVNDTGTDPYRLQLHPSGTWQVLYHDLATRGPTDTEGWAYVRHNGVWDREMFGQCVTAISFGGTGTFAPWVQNQTTPGYKTDSPITCHHSFFQSAGDVSPDQIMRAKWYTDLKRWEVTDAEC